MKATIPAPCFCLLLLCVLLAASCKNKTLFQTVPSSHSGIRFNNQIVENDTLNPIDVTNIYNGGGVGIGDFNNDGLKDIYFTGNLVPNQLYLNKGNLKFEEITKAAGVDGGGRWSRGVAVVDINNDGWQDIYVCASMLDDVRRRENLLYVNQGADRNNVPHFREMAAEYGLNDTTHSTMAAFFDYDNDGDLDMYLVVNQILKDDNPAVFRPKITDGSHPSTGRLYRNDIDSFRKHPVFTNVTKQAGVTIEGYGHGVSIADFNRDGWKDIFVTNDFNSTDLLYINNHDGTFTDKAETYFKHTSANGMGQDVIDINNDGLSDVVELDMSPEDNFRKKMMLGANSYQTFQNSDHFGYQYQYVRNSLQLNRGPRMLGNDSVGDPIFSDVGYFAGIAETDWSWTPLVTDFDNDSYRDIVVTNGFPKDVTDRDFIAFRREAFSIATKKYILDQIPQVKIHNYAFRNKGEAMFENTTQKWGLMEPFFSSGGAYADLDNDGDMEMVINNIGDEAALYENTMIDGNDIDAHYLGVQLAGDATNRNGIGSWIEVYYRGQHQAFEVTPYRGYLSSVQLEPHFGLGKVSSVDSLVVKWPNGKKQLIRNVQADQIVQLKISDATEHHSWNRPAFYKATLLADITDSLNLQFVQKQRDFVDFNIQKLLPHKFTEYGPALAVGDVNGDGIEDMVAGGSNYSPATLLLQQSNGTFIKRQLPVKDTLQHWIDMGVTLFDVDQDGDLDLYIARGGYQEQPNSKLYQDQLWVNDGKANFAWNETALPVILTSKSCVRPFDYDKDGDLDLFLAGRVEPWNYPRPVSSFILRNESQGGKVKFSDVTATVAPFLANTGMVCDVVSTDFNADGWPDLVMAGEWMPVRFLKNEKGVFREITSETGVAGKLGWWNSILPADVDNDGDMDYVVSNLGLNSYFRASEKEPVKIYAKDFDKNGSFDAIPTLYLRRSHDNPERKEFPAHTRDDMTKQMISFRSKFQNYKSYATATFSQMFTPEELDGALVLKANEFRHMLFKNLGQGRFDPVALPLTSQYTCLNGMVAEDLDDDGNLDIVASGNDFGTEPSVGRYDACNGLVLKGDGKGGFTPLSILQSGLFIPGNGKALVKLKNSNGQTLLAVTQHRGPMKLFLMKEAAATIALQPADVSAILHLRNGKKQKQEIGYGSSFLSQSGRFINVGSQVAFAEVWEASGKVRTVAGQENPTVRR